jgi:hypothetical protein
VQVLDQQIPPSGSITKQNADILPCLGIYASAFRR